MNGRGEEDEAFPDLEKQYVGLVVRAEPRRPHPGAFIRFGASGRMLEDFISRENLPRVYFALKAEGIGVMEWDDEDYLVADRERFKDEEEFSRRIQDVTRKIAGRGILVEVQKYL